MVWKCKRIIWISLGTVGLVWMASCFSYVGELESNHAWMVFDPSNEQGMASAFADKFDPNILYLIFVRENGLAVKINLKEKAIKPIQFPSDKGDPQMTVAYLRVGSRTGKEGAYTVYVNPGGNRITERLPFWDEFRGRVVPYPSFHLYGFPFAHDPGTRSVKARFGEWYVMEQRNGRKMELLRTRVWNSELYGDDAIGQMELSPDRKWVVFRLAGHPERVFIFNRETPGVEALQ